MLHDLALVVGIDRYPGLTPLSGAERDAKEFFAWVTDPKGGAVAPERATLLLSANFAAQFVPPRDGVNGALPVKDQVEQFFSDVEDLAQQNNAANLGLVAGRRLWLYFSGHGFATSVDLSGVLMANATETKVHNVAAKSWADRLHQGGWFNQVILIQDACHKFFPTAEPTLPFLQSRQARPSQRRERFYAFAAEAGKLAKEVPMPDGATRGVFTTTLLRGLRGEARDERSGAVTTASLKAYLEANMQRLLPAQDLQNDRIAKRPLVMDFNAFDLLPQAAATPLVAVKIMFPHAGVSARILGSDFTLIARIDAAPDTWDLQLRNGLYLLLAPGLADTKFEVTGAVDPAVGAQVVPVHV